MGMPLEMPFQSQQGTVLPHFRCLRAHLPSWGFAMSWTVVENDRERPNIERTHPRMRPYERERSGFGEIAGNKER